jgi:hypothetical protein
MTLTTTIKKIYYNQILSGEKTVEYRSIKPYYRGVADGTVKTLRLHYYDASRYLLVDIESVAKVRCSKALRDSGIDFTGTVYAIHLTNPREVLPSADAK